MAQVVAVDWDRHEARYVLGTTLGSKVTVQAVGSVSLVDVAEGGNEPHPDLSGSLAAALANQKVGRALVGVERSSIELLHFTLPPATDRELPELVANQAMRESQLITEQSVLDFQPIDADPAAPRSVIAAALSPDEFERIQQVCAAAGLKPARLLLRPFAAASLLARTASPEEEVYLLLTRLNDEVDLTIVVDQRPVFFRTVRLPEGASESEATERLLTEINRTLAAAPHSHYGGEGVECVYIFGRSEDHQDLADRVRDGLFLPARVFDPFEALRVPGRLVPENSGRFAPLLGMLLDEAARSHAIDFLHPRQVPKPVNRGRIAMIAGGVLAAVVLGVALNAWSTWSAINQENVQLTQRLRQLDETTKKAAEQKKLIDAVREWKTRDVIWLDELRDLSLRFPSARDVVVLRMSMTPSQSGGGVIDLEGLVRDPKIVVNIEGQVRDQYRRVRSKRIQERKLEKDYTWLFETSMGVVGRPTSAYVSHLPAEEQLAAKPAEEPPAAESDAVADAGTSDPAPKVAPTVRKASQ